MPQDDPATDKADEKPEKPSAADQGGGSDDYAATAADTDEPSKLRKEAANYRTKLRKAEAERDQLAARISDYDRAEVERQVGGEGGLHNPSDLWLAGVQLDELRDDEGALDPEKVKAARDRVINEHRHWRKPGPSFDAGAREPAPIDKGVSFGEALKKAAG